MKKINLVVSLLFLSLLLFGCGKQQKEPITIKEIYECGNIDLSEYDKRIKNLEQQMIELKIESAKNIQELSDEITTKIASETNSNSWELQQVSDKLNKKIEKISDVTDCISRGGQFINNICQM